MQLVDPLNSDLGI